MATGLYRLDIRGNLAGQYRENVLHFQGTGITPIAPWTDAKEVLVSFDANYLASWLGVLPPDYQVDALVCRQVGPIPGSYSIFDYVDGEQVGQRGAEAASEQLCPCVTLIPTLGVKSAGRVFLPAVDKSDIQANVPTGGYKTAVTNLFNALIAGNSFLGGNLALCIYSRKLNTASAISTFQLSPVLGYQRRRATPVGV